MTGRIRTVFFGSSEFSLPALRRMIAEHDVVAVCTQPDRPAGRGLALTPTPVAAFARQAGIELLTPARLDEQAIAQIAARKPALLAVASYGKILPRALLAIPGATALNVHPSMLPAYRGATPIQAALRDGCVETGVTVFWMDAGMDDGDIALAQPVKIDPEDDYGSLHDSLAAVGAELLAEAARRLGAGTLARTPQRDEDATYTKPLTKDDLRLRLDVPAQTAVNQVRSLAPKPGAWTMLYGKRLKVLKARVATAADAQEEPVLATQPGAIVLTVVVPEGKPPMKGVEFARRSRARG
jgi:methionyl-tRNA formyltransferase